MAMKVKRKKRLILSLSIGVLLTIVLVFVYRVKIMKPEIGVRFLEETYDFGIEEEQQEVARIFKFKNIGKKTITPADLHVRSTCDCTAALATDKSVPPGSFGEVEVSINTGSHRGKMQRTINIYLGEKEEPVALVQLAIKGVVKGSLAYSPHMLYFGDLVQGKSAFKTLKVWDLGYEDLEIVKVETTSEHLSTEVSEYEEDKLPGAAGTKAYVVKVSVSPAIPAGRIDEKVVIHTNLKKRPLIEIPIVINVTGEITVFPEKIFFGVVKNGETPSRTVTLTSSSPDVTYSIKEVRVAGKYLSIEQVTLEEGRKYQIRVDLKSDLPAGILKGEIQVLTTNEKYPVISIPYYCMVIQDNSLPRTNRR